MSFTSVTFLILLPISIVVYYLLPQKIRYIWLLLVSYFFYTTQSSSFTTQLLLSTIITWISGGLVYNLKKPLHKKICIAIGIILNVSMLIFFKYTNFIISLFNSSDSAKLNIILPAGISFYTFQSLTYIIDCYRGDVKPERNIFKYALFVSFFPLILAGPIERAKNLLPQFDKDIEFNPDMAKEGLFLMLYGYFLKMVITSRVSILTSSVFSDYANKSGSALLIALLFYTFEIYCDFAGYSSIAIGMCRVMGIDIIRNFRQPYLAVSVADFWRRWHISLSSWFKDYVYIPLGGNRKGTIRKYINIMIVFLLSGIWHGANLTFVLWGFLNGIYQIIGDLCKPIKKTIISKTKLENKKSLLRTFETIITFILISVTWIFFRANSINEAFAILAKIFTRFNYVNLIDGTIFSLGLGTFNLLFAIAAIILLIVSDILCEKKECEPSKLLENTPLILRWVIYYLIIMMIIFSCNLSTQEFIYQQF